MSQSFYKQKPRNHTAEHTNLAINLGRMANVKSPSFCSIVIAQAIKQPI